MRKNRSNNGYIGLDKISMYDGSMAPYNFQIESSRQFRDSSMKFYNMPTNGNGYGATAFVGLTNGILLGAYITDYNSGGTGYVDGQNFNKFIVSGGGGPTASGFVSAISSSTIQQLALFRRIGSVEVTDGGRGITSPTVTFTTGPFNSSLTASIDGNTLNVTAYTVQVWPGSLLSGTGVTGGTIITGLGTGRGGTGTYTINNSHTLTSRSMTTSTTATATVIVQNNTVTGVSLTYPGLYASTYPTITWAGIPTDENLPVAEAYLENPTGYSSNPTITFVNPPSGSGSTASGATASALVVYQINNIGISAGGQEYSSSPSISIKGADLAFTETATISGGTISEIQISSSIDETRRFAFTPTVTIGGWKDLPSVTAGEDKFVGTYAIFDRDNHVAFKAGQTYNVDWGDGTTGTFNSGATASKIYSSSVFAGITQNPIDGYKTLTIQITPVSGARLTTLDFNVKHPNQTSGTYTTAQWLNMKMAGNTLSSLSIVTGAANIRQHMLESFEFVGSPGNLTSLVSAFADCTSLKRYNAVNLTENCTNLAQMFSSCVSLRSIDEINTNKATSINAMFQTCRSLETPPKMNTALVTNFSNTFSSCTNLRVVPLYDLRSATTMASMFQNCYRLKTVPLFNTVNVTSFNSTFSGCYALESVPLFSTKRASDLSSMFSGCSSLREVPKFNTESCTTMASMFTSCGALKSVPFFDKQKVTLMSSMFQNCNSLERVPNFDTRKVTSIATMFANCYNLEKAPDFDLREVTDASSAFSSSGINSCPPLYMPKVTTCSNMFGSCVSLRNVGNIFATSCSNYGNMFTGCSSLEYPPELVTMGFNRAGNFQYMSSMFSNCNSMKRVPSVFNVTLQTVNSSSSNFNMFSLCYLVTEIPEYDFLGVTGSNNTSALSGVFQGLNTLQRIKARNFCQSFSLPNPNMMGATALNELYTNLAVVGASGANAKTLTVTGSLGTASDDISIAISKGWAVTG